jgi:glycine oxidase
MNWDVIISGAGIIGVSLALELRHRGAQVLVLERGEPGRESSSAAAGMISDADPETPQELRLLARESAAMFPAFVDSLESVSGMKVDLHRGAIALFRTHQNLRDHKLLTSAEIKHIEPLLHARGCPAYLIAEENCVDPELLMQAALRAALAAGVDFRGHAPVERMAFTGGHVQVISANDRFWAKTAVNCQGAWAGAPVRPRKGQMLCLQPKNQALLNHVIRAPEVYLVRRSSGRILVGSTVENVGFDKSVVAQTIQKLHHAAATFVPALAGAPVVATWAGLRPGTPDDLPILGRLETPGIFIATGHFRNGILLAPITARIMADLISGKTAPLDISAFSPARFTNATMGR